MSSSRTTMVLLAAMAFTITLAAPGEAEARKRGLIPFLFNWGDDLIEAGEVPEPFNEAIPDKKAGFKCSVFGLFWAYIHWWDCEATVLESSDTYYTDTPDELKELIAEKYKPSDGMNFWNKHGRWIYLAAIIGFGVMGVMGSKNESVDDDDEDLPPVASDEPRAP